MEFPGKKETTIRISSYDLDTFIQHHLGGTFDFVPTEECGNDSSHRFTVDKPKHFNVDTKTYDPGFNEWDQKVIDEYLETGTAQTFTTGVILDHLCDKGLIEPGNYLVDVCW